MSNLTKPRIDDDRAAVGAARQCEPIGVLLVPKKPRHVAGVGEPNSGLDPDAPQEILSLPLNLLRLGPGREPLPERVVIEGRRGGVLGLQQRLVAALRRLLR